MLVMVTAIAATIPVGVAPGDGVDDGPGLRAALATACVTDHLLDLRGIPPGVYDLTQEDGKLGALNVTGCSVAIVGHSRVATRLRMIPKYMAPSADWYLVNVDGGSADVEIADLTLDGRRDAFAALGAVAEQVHLVRPYNVSRLDVHDVDLVDSFGDCVKNIGTHDGGFVNVRCMNARRDGIGSHDNSTDIRIVASSFSSVSDQQIATEGSGGNKRWTIVGNSGGIHNGGAAYDLSNGASDFAVVGNVVEEGAIQLYGVDRFAVVGNVLPQYVTTSAEPMLLYGRNADVAVVGNVVLRAATSVGTACMGATYIDAARDPSALVFVGNLCRHASPYGLMVTSGTGRMVLSSNLMLSTAPSGGVGFYAGAMGGAVRGISIDGNVASNELTGFNVEGLFGSMDDIALVGNSAVSSKPVSSGSYTTVYNHAPYSIPHITRCRADANVFDVAGPAIYNTSTVSPYPTGTQGCTLRGTDAVP